jgi:sarcosine oxidase subunit gamma
MPELTRSSALGAAPPAVHSVPGVELRELPLVPMLRLQALGADLASLSRSAPEVLPFTPNRSLGADPWILWRAPGDWLTYSLTAPMEELERTLRGDLSGSALYWMDVSSTGAMFEISGPGALDVLLRDCTLDLEGGAVPPGGCAQTPIAQLMVMIHRPSVEPLWRLWVDRSAARHLWAWLVDSTALAMPASGTSRPAR